MPGKDLCLPSANELKSIGDGLYVNYTNLDYNFLHRNTGISVKANIPNICFQFPEDMSENTRQLKFRIAMGSAITMTERYLNKKFATNPLVPPMIFSEVWKAHIKTALGAQFGSRSSVSSNCYAVPLTPAYWKC